MCNWHLALCSLQWAVLMSPSFFVHIMPKVVFPLLFHFLLFHVSVFLYFSSLFSACQQGFYFFTHRHTKGSLIWNVTYNLVFHSKNFINSYKIWKALFCTQLYIKKKTKPESWTKNVFSSIIFLFHQKKKSKIKTKQNKKCKLRLFLFYDVEDIWKKF